MLVPGITATRADSGVSARHYDSCVRLAILGATGSIGGTTLQLCERYPEKFKVVALSGNENLELLAEHCSRFKPAYVALTDEKKRSALLEALRQRTAYSPEIVAGSTAIEEIAQLTEVDTVVAAVVGIAGLGPVLKALRAGKRVALANKESLVAGGALVREALHGGHGELLPVDSEHAALFQALQGVTLNEVERLVLTASGGPFLRRDPKTLSAVTPAEAVRHPRWKMGAKISVDSATLMNKGLELIEAHWLFGVPENRIGVLIHPQSVVHGIVELCDGSQLLHAGHTDMSGPIAAALTYPQRLTGVLKSLELSLLRTLEFEPADENRFPALALARGALTAGGYTTAVLNSANEAAVTEFLAGRMNFDQIVPSVEAALERFAQCEMSSLDALLHLHHEVQNYVVQRSIHAA